MLQEEEQLELLGKMILHTAEFLSQREREVYDKLVENISKRVSRLQRIERQTLKLKRIPGEQPPEFLETNQSRKQVVKNLSAEQVVQRFVDSWNTGAFEDEYYCLSRNCEKGERNSLPFEDYISMRRKRWEDRNVAGIVEKQLQDDITCEMHGSRAIVKCNEVHITHDEEILLAREYQLVYEDGGWRIIDFVTKSRDYRPLSSHPS